MILDFWSNFNKKMITEIEKKITEIIKIAGRDAVNRDTHRRNLSVHLRYHPERSEVR